MLFQKLMTTKKVLPVQYLTSTFLVAQTSDASRTLTLSSGFSVGDMLVSMTANRISTPPNLLSGYTDIASVTGGAVRSQRIQYKIATSTSETITWTGAYGYLLVLKNATRIGQSGVVSTGATSNPALPDLSGLNTNGTGFILAGSYVNNYTTVTSPYAFLINGAASLAAYIQNNTNSSLTSKSIASGGSFNSSYAVEFLP